MTDWLDRHVEAENARRLAAQVDGAHYSAKASRIKSLIRKGDDDEAAGILLRVIEAIERECQYPLAGHTYVPQLYFSQLESIYERRGMAREAALLHQKYVMLLAKAEADGLRLKIEMERAIGTDPGRAPRRTAAKPKPAATRTRRRPSYTAGRAAGKLLGKLARMLWRAMAK